MGIHQHGALGGFSGKVGPIVGAKWKNKETIRARPRKNKTKKKNLSQEIIAQRARFVLTAKFLRSMRDVLSLTFPEVTSSISGRNNALATIIRKAITGTYPDLQLVYSEIQIASGSVGDPVNPTANSTEPGVIDFTWYKKGLGTGSKDEDKAVMVAYCPAMNVCFHSVGDFTRQDGGGKLDVEFFSGKEVHLWVCFMSDKLKQASASKYVKSLTVA